MPTVEYVIELENVRDYEPGRFYFRELPCIQVVLDKLDGQPEVIVVDGYVWLDEQNTLGLRAHLYLYKALYLAGNAPHDKGTSDASLASTIASADAETSSLPCNCPATSAIKRVAAATLRKSVTDRPQAIDEVLGVNV